MNNEQIPESVIKEWRDAANRLKIGHVFEFEVDFYIEGCKSQYPFREKLEEVNERADDIFARALSAEADNKVLRDALEKTTDYAIILKGMWQAKVKDSDQKDKAINELAEAIEFAQQALKQTEL